ncbi:hypothetical protein V8G54_036849 [Vigna mungo]|uniref:Uncharacterized protein n=1 Tax=Vigna mungo TaxID=3915 RepID=A0AAQ3MI98_VIGMU
MKCSHFLLYLEPVTVLCNYEFPNCFSNICAHWTWSEACHGQPCPPFSGDFVPFYSILALTSHNVDNVLCQALPFNIHPVLAIPRQSCIKSVKHSRIVIVCFNKSLEKRGGVGVHVLLHNCHKFWIQALNHAKKLISLVHCGYSFITHVMKLECKVHYKCFPRTTIEH